MKKTRKHTYGSRTGINRSLSTTAAAALVLSAVAFHANAQTLASENFATAADATALNGFTPAGTDSGFSGSWAQTTGETQTIATSANSGAGSGGWTGATGFLTTDGFTASAHDQWNTSRATISLSTPINLSLNGAFTLSCDLISDGSNTGVVLGLSNGTQDLLGGLVYGNVGASLLAINTGGMDAYSSAFSGWAPTYGGAAYYQMVDTLTESSGDLTVNTSFYLDGAGAALDSTTTDLGLVSGTFSSLVLKQDGWNDVSDITVANVSSVPEPSNMSLCGLGILALLALKRKNATC